MLYSEHMFKYQHQHRDQENWVQIVCSVPRDYKKNENTGYRVIYRQSGTLGETENKSLASITELWSTDTHQAATHSIHRKNT